MLRRALRKLSEEQLKIYKLVVEEKCSVFYTGSAGTGKSFLLRIIIEGLRERYSPEEVAVTAITRLAAARINGETVHSFAGIGLGEGSAQDLLRRMGYTVKQRWLKTKVLVLDEVSMMSAELFDKLETIAREIRSGQHGLPADTQTPFGGLQLVVTGDFFLLPPVERVVGGSYTRYAFQAAKWGISLPLTIQLRHVFRQKDYRFAQMLEDLRRGRKAPEVLAYFRRLDREPSLLTEGGIKMTELYATKAEAAKVNSAHLAQIESDTVVFTAVDQDPEGPASMHMLQPSGASSRIALKRGARVMLTIEALDWLIYGTIGQVVSFQTEKDFAERVDPEDMTTDSVQFDVHAPRYPVVVFEGPRRVTKGGIVPPVVSRETALDGRRVCRTQVPLELAWALTIHMAQGRSLDCMKVDLCGVFDFGQVYSALSRATSIEGLQVKNFPTDGVVADPRVVEFYDSLERLNSEPLDYESLVREAEEFDHTLGTSSGNAEQVVRGI